MRPTPAGSPHSPAAGEQLAPLKGQLAQVTLGTPPAAPAAGKLLWLCGPARRLPKGRKGPQGGETASCLKPVPLGPNWGRLIGRDSHQPSSRVPDFASFPRRFLSPALRRRGAGTKGRPRPGKSEKEWKSPHLFGRLLVG